MLDLVYNGYWVQASLKLDTFVIRVPSALNPAGARLVHGAECHFLIDFVQATTSTAIMLVSAAEDFNATLRKVFDAVLKIDIACEETEQKKQLGVIFDKQVQDLSTMRRIAELTHNLSNTISLEQSKRTVPAAMPQKIV